MHVFFGCQSCDICLRFTLTSCLHIATLISERIVLLPWRCIMEIVFDKRFHHLTVDRTFVSHDSPQYSICSSELISNGYDAIVCDCAGYIVSKLERILNSKEIPVAYRSLRRKSQRCQNH